MGTENEAELDEGVDELYVDNAYRRMLLVFLYYYVRRCFGNYGRISPLLSKQLASRGRELL